MSRYASLQNHLERTDSSPLRMTFADIEVLTGSLPMSARRYRPWWANDRTHSQGRAWLAAGWQVTDVDLTGEHVTFSRVPTGSRHHASRTEAEASAERRDRTRDAVSPSPAQTLGISAGRTLIVLPCSGSKAPPEQRNGEGRSILADLPLALADRLAHARANNRVRARVDDRRLLPAWQRYTGRLYSEGGGPIGHALSRRFHIVIISGGYGVVRGDELIGWYDAIFDPRWWPGRVVEECLTAYAKRYDLSEVVAFAGRTTPYARVIRRASWHEIGVSGILVTPMVSSGAALSEVPKTIGEALASLLATGTLGSDWTSTSGTALRFESLGGPDKVH